MKSNTLRRLITISMAVTGLFTVAGMAGAASQTTVVSGGGARPSQPIYIPPGTARPTPPIATLPGAVRPEQPIYIPPGTIDTRRSSGWVDTSQQFGLPCPGITSIIAGKIYYVCGDQYFLEQTGPNGSTYVPVAAPY